MEIVTPIEDKEVIDLDFTFNNGILFSQTIDESSGDSYQEHTDRFTIVMSAKPHPVNTDQIRPEEVANIYKSNILMVVSKKRKVRKPTEEELFDSKNYLYKLSKAVH